MFIPPGTDEHRVINNLKETIPLLPTDNILEFYDTRMAHYSSSYPRKTFCNGLEMLFKDIADMPNWVTLVSMNDDDVFAILIFNINRLDKNGNIDPTIDIYIELFCGNQALPPSGEGTRMLEILERAGFDTKNFKIELASVPKSVQYYSNKKYYKKKNLDKSYGNLVSMRKDTQALSRWSKIRESFTPSSIRYLDKLYSSTKASRAKGLKGKKTKGKKTKGKKTKGKSRKTKGKKTKGRRSK